MNNDIFIDGIIFGDKTFGGVARMWTEIIPRLTHQDLLLTLLLPARNNFPAIHSIKGSINILKDYFYWPKRIFSKVELRSKILTDIYRASNAKIFHSSYFTTIESSHTLTFLTVYDMIYEILENQTSSNWVEQVIYNKRKSIESANYLICISESTKRDLLKFFPSIADERIAVIYPGISDLSQDDLEVSISHIADKYGHQLSAKDYFLLVGKLGGYKNFQLILDLVSQNPRARGFTFLCVGSGTTSKLREIAIRSYPESFIFLDFVTDKELSVLYQNAIGLVCPSLYEGFGLPVVEAMSNSCPVACSNSSSLPEAGGDAAFYFDPSSPVELYRRLIDLTNCNRSEVISKGLEHASKFSWENAVAALLALYKKAM